MMWALIMFLCAVIGCCGALFLLSMLDRSRPLLALFGTIAIVIVGAVGLTYLSFWTGIAP